LTNAFDKRIFYVDILAEASVMKIKVQKWGNSLAVRIPKSIASNVGIQNNSPVDMSLINGKLVVTPMNKAKLSLKKLLAQVTQDNLHREIDTGM
jgi:antitoxin MazE